MVDFSVIPKLSGPFWLLMSRPFSGANARVHFSGLDTTYCSGPHSHREELRKQDPFARKADLGVAPTTCC
jgi:hypothetical protein